MSVELFKVKKCFKTRKVFEFLKLTAEPKVLENLKSSWKKAWKGMEFEELKRAQTLTHKHADPFELGFFLRKHSLKMV